MENVYKTVFESYNRANNMGSSSIYSVTGQDGYQQAWTIPWMSHIKSVELADLIMDVYVQEIKTIDIL